MDIVEAFAFMALFIGLYGTMVVIGWALDKFLRYTCNRGIFPKDYFK
jgi:hypothetical protein